MSRPRWFAWALLVFALFCSEKASAYPWMLRHEYTACGQCHVDPSGSGPLTRYGRAMGEVVLRTHFGAEPGEGQEDDAEEEPGAAAKPLFGAVELPEWLDIGGAFRIAALSKKAENTALDNRLIWMQLELNASIQAGRFVASGALGFSPEGATYAAITRSPDNNLVSRYHWLGYKLDEAGSMLVRGGRMNVPFGIRDTDHTLWVRDYTNSQTNDAQQHGIAFSYSGPKLRGEAMAILGNYQIRPDDYRERGYSGFAEWTPMTRLGAGISSRVTHVSLDERVGRAAFRHAHGAFVRWATPWEPLVLMSETDYVVRSYDGRPRVQGVVAMLQADLEIFQGLHYRVTGELQDYGPRDAAFASYSGWSTLQWFCASHLDVRLDGVYQSFGTEQGSTGVTMLLAQAHLYL